MTDRQKIFVSLEKRLYIVNYPRSLPPDGLTRRAVLGAVVASSLGGCQRVLGSLEEDGTRLGEVSLTNLHTEPHAVDLRIVWDGEMVLNETYELDADDPGDIRAPGMTPEVVWPTTSGQFTIAARLDGTEWKTFDPAEYGYPTCCGFMARIDESGYLGIFVSTDTSKCQNLTTADPSQGN